MWYEYGKTRNKLKPHQEATGQTFQPLPFDEKLNDKKVAHRGLRNMIFLLYFKLK